jgi:ABC-type maltose transport system permease subunit
VAAASILISIPVLIGLAYIQRYFVQGLTGGAVKG